MPRLHDAEEAHRSLTDTCLDEELLAELDGVTARLKAANTRRVQLEYEIRFLRDGAESDLYDIRFSEWPLQVSKLERRAEERKDKADALAPELEHVRAEIAELDKREKELREQLLQPSWRGSICRGLRRTVESCAISNKTSKTAV